MRQQHTALQAIGREQLQLSCRFLTNGSSDPATYYGQGVKSVTHTATGKWKVTFYEQGKRAVGCALGLGLATPAAGTLSAVIDDEGTGGEISVTVSHFTSALADIAADADNWISVILDVEQA